MKKQYILSFFLTAILGTVWHDLYDLIPFRLVGVIAPVNESVWEHLKLLYFPVLAVGIPLCLIRKTGQGGLLAGILVMPIMMLGLYYTLAGGFRMEALWIDILIYYVALALGWLLAWHLRNMAAGVLVIPAGVYGAALAVFTLAPPNFPIFLSK